MSIPKLPEDVGSTEPIFPTQPTGLPGRGEVPGQSFASVLQGTPTPMQAAGKSSQISPFDLVAGQPLTHNPSPETIHTQLQQVRGTLNDVSNQLSTPNLPLKPSQKQLLKSKLLDANGHLRSANEMMGAQIPKPVDPSKFKGPLGRFFGWLTHGQMLMESAGARLHQMGSSGKPLNAGDFLAIQVKIGQAQQELEFSSVLLANAVQAFKTLMQLQI